MPVLHRSLVPKLCSAHPKGSATTSQWIRGYIYIMTTLKFTAILSKWRMFCWNNSRGTSLIRMSVRISNYETYCTHEPNVNQFNWDQIIQFNWDQIIQFNWGQIMQCILTYASGLAVCIGTYLKSVLRYKYIILVVIWTIPCLCEQGCEDLWSFFEVKRGPGYPLRVSATPPPTKL